MDMTTETVSANAGERCPFGPTLRRLRLAKGLSQRELAERAHLTVQGVSALERGIRVTPYKTTVRLLAGALGLSEDERATLEAAAPPRLGATRAVNDANPHAPPVHLPPSAFIGREDDLHGVASLLSGGDARLVTLTGPGGVGKTRLALHVAASLHGAFGGQVYVVSLATVVDAAAVAPAIAAAFGIKETGQRPAAESLALRLRDRRVLLVLDNLEHLPCCAALVAALLQECPRLTLLATSRAPLHVQGEHEWRVQPLALPVATATASDAAMAQVPSVALFLDRARAARRDVDPATSLATIAQICARLDGLPLAIELAAARVRHLPLPALLARLDHRFQVLTGGAIDLPERQQTMRRTLDWSYDLLSPHEQALLRRLAVFAGTFSLDAVADVCSPDGETGATLLDDISALVDNSVVQLHSRGGITPHYTLLGIVREYVHEQLVASGELKRLQARHAAYMLRLAEQAEPALRGPAQAQWLARLEDAHDDLRAALRWACEPGGCPATGLRLAAALWRFWWAHGYLTEGRAWLERVLDARSSLAPEAGDDPPAAPALARALMGAGILAAEQAAFAQATAYLQRSLDLRRTTGDARGIAETLNSLGTVARDQGAYHRAEALFTESLAALQPAGDARVTATTLSNLGEVARYLGDLDRAAALHEQSLQMRREAGDEEGIAVSLYNRGLVAHDRGDDAYALCLYTESLALFYAGGDRVGVAWSLEGLAGACGALGQLERAARIFGAAAALREAVGAPVPPAARAAYDRALQAVRLQLEAASGGDDAFAVAWGRGRNMALDEAVDEACAAYTRDDGRAIARRGVKG